jgi:hypothetical protein
MACIIVACTRQSVKWPTFSGKLVVLRVIVGYWVRGKEGLAGMQRNPCLSSSLKSALQRLGGK